MIEDEDIEKLKKLLKTREDGSNIEITGDIAVGGMGRVLLAKDKIIDREIAFKVLHEDMEENNEMYRQFVDEARITGLLEHSNIVPVHSLGINAEGHVYFTMKFVNGDSLLEAIEQLSKGNQEYLDYYTHFMRLRIFRKVCDAVSFAHSKNVLHRDIKPENIMIGAYGEVMLMDWGIAKFKDAAERASSSDVELDLAEPMQTLDGTIKGSPAYMSPEQARGEMAEYDTRSEVFLLGATLYHLMTLKPPYYDNEVSVMVVKAEKADFVPPGKAAPDQQIPDELSHIIQKAMSLNKDDRFQSVADFTNAIDNLMSGQIMSTKKKYKAGEDIIRHGDSGNEAYVIVEGEVEVYKKFAGKKTVFTRLHAGDVFGEMASITDTVRSASIAAITDTTCLLITPETLTEQLHKMPPWLEKIITALSNRLLSMDNLAHPLLISDCTYEVSNQLKLLMMCYGVVNKDSFLSHNLPEVIYEISNNLKIPEERVRPVIAGLADINLLSIDDKLDIVIPNWNLFSDFVDFCKDSHRLSTTSTRNLTTVDIHKVYTDGNSVIHRHSKLSPNEKMPPLKTMKPLKDTMPTDEAVAFRQNFMNKLQEISDYAAKSESLNKSMFNNRIVRQVFNPSEAPKISDKFKDV
ncbi:MAG: protein kinase [Lentisphaeraceae bacterium]|nr:protein kinase [Lentisphaeraceae bacterium]